MTNTITDYQNSLTLLFDSYSGSVDKTYLHKGIRMSQNLDIDDYDEQVLATLHRVTLDTSTTITNIETLINSGSAVNVNEYQQLLSETDVQYMNRLNNVPILSKVKHIELTDDNEVINYNCTNNIPTKNTNNILLDINNYK